MYGVADYDVMLADAVRSAAYVAAISRAVRAGDVVVEIGTGVGFFAVAAARAGARHVYAIEMAEAIALGPEVARANGCADAITFVHGRSERVALPERGDVLIEDLRGVLPFEGGHIPAVVDARARHVRTGATIVPARDTLWAAPCEADARFRERHMAQGGAPFGIDRRVVEACVRQSWYRARLEAEQLFAPPETWGALEYAAVTSGDLSGRAEWTMERGGRLDGVAAWFDTDLGFGCGFTNAPGKPRAIYGQAFFPFPGAVDVERGDRLVTAFHAKLVDDGYVFGWDSLFEPCGPERPSVRFRQSNLGASPALAETLRRRREDHRPHPRASALLLRDLLALADGEHSLREIAETLVRAHPARFADTAAALRFAAERLAALEDDDSLDGAR